MKGQSAVQRVGNCLCMLLIFLFVADPTNTILHLKIPVFALFMAFNLLFLKADWGKLLYSFIPIIAVLVAWLFAQMRQAVIDYDELKACVTSFMILCFLPWVRHYDIIALSKIPMLATALIAITLFWVIVFFPYTEGYIYNFMKAHDHTIMMSRRVFLGVSMFSMYYKSTAAFMIVLGVALFSLMKKGKKKLLDILLVAALVNMLAISGTRSSMLLPCVLCGCLCLIFMRNRRYLRYIVYPLCTVTAIGLLVVLVKLLAETGEPSNLVKYGHLESYKVLFSENPLFLLTGQGPGTYFFTDGFHQMTLKTEWTYIEMVRNYGILCLPILYVLVRPLFVLLRFFNKNDEAIAVAISFIIYLVIAGTNPLLLSSTGMLVVLTVYSFVERNCVEPAHEN